MKGLKIILSAILIFVISSLTVIAIEKSEKIQVYYRNIKVALNGSEVSLKEEPFIYNDRVYVPLRSISEINGWEVSWDGEKNRVLISTFRNFPEVDPLKGERFIYGEILSIDREKRILHIYQHIDDNSLYEEPNIEVAKNAVIILQRNDKRINLEFEDLKIGDMVGLAVNRENKVRGIIIDG